MEWISVKDKLPDTNYCCCLVSNERGWMHAVRAIYHKGDNIFTLNDPNYRKSLTLDVTHYLPYE